MPELLIAALAGFVASLVDGALGMGFGPTSATLLLSTGVSPATTSTMVNLAKVATGLAAGASHWRLGNVDRRLVLQLAVPGACGAVIGVAVLATVDGDRLRPALAVLLLAVGVRILVRFSRPLTAAPTAAAGDRRRSSAMAVTGAAGGITNGLVGAWGPVVTPVLLHRGVAPRIAVGSVNTAEVAVAVTAAGSLIGSMGSRGIEIPMVLAMLAGGVGAAPLAAVVVQRIPARLLGVAVAALLLLTQTRELLHAGAVPPVPAVAYGAVAVAVAAALVRPRLRGALAVP
ncbi:MAG TPA: sulfite exporter TauE/SafE family protein [Acidimicrobiales bacterium]|nr:sulfite exporter TauE/SafE family protein [Acidimicrobiales bacterium]